MGLPFLVACLLIWRKGRQAEEVWPWGAWEGIVGLIAGMLIPALYLGYSVYPLYPEYTALWAPLGGFVRWISLGVLVFSASYVAYRVTREKAYAIRDTAGELAYVASWALVALIVGLLAFALPEVSIYDKGLSGWMWRLPGVTEGTGTGGVDLVWNSPLMARNGYYYLMAIGIGIFTVTYAYTHREGRLQKRRWAVSTPVALIILFVAVMAILEVSNIAGEFVMLGREFLGLGYSYQDFSLLDPGTWGLENLEFPDFSTITVEGLNVPNPVESAQSQYEEFISDIQSQLGG